MIVFDNVKKILDGKTVLDLKELTIPKGALYGLIGANGAGKSTMLRLISGVYTADEGVVSVDGENILDNAKMKEKLFFVPDDPYFLPQATLNDMASFYQTYYRNFDYELYRQLCASFDLPIKDKIISYSKGMKRQAIILLALSTHPEYLLLDESFDGLDSVMRQKVRRILVDIAAQRNITVIISSHNLRELDELCDYVGVVYQGKLLYNIAMEELKKRIHKYQLAFSSPVTEEYLSRFSLLSCKIVGKFVTIVAKGEAEILEQKINMLQPLAMEKFPLTLEEIFIYEMEAKGYDYQNIFA